MYSILYIFREVKKKSTVDLTKTVDKVCIVDYTTVKEVKTMKCNLKELRKAKGLTQSALAERAGVARVTINRLETGQLQETTIGTLIKLAKALDAKLDDLVLFSA